MTSDTKATRKPPGGRPPTKMATGAVLHLPDDEVDGNSASAKRWRDLVHAHLAEAGITNPTERQLRLCKTAASATRQLEVMEAGLCRGEKFSDLSYERLNRTLNKARRGLGLDGGPAKNTKDDGDDLATIAAKRGKALPKAKQLPSLADQED